MLAPQRSLQVTTIRRLLRHKWVGVAWLFNALFSVALVAASAHVVLRWAPAAAGSGVPGVMAQLHGCRLPRVFEWRTAAVKFASAVLCVGSGLPVGPEGPMIFLGATLGGLLSQGTGFLRRWPLLRRAWPFERFRNSKDKRDFMTAGCAAGVAAAFGAPIGGLLFVFEDVASSWTSSLGYQVFITCMVSVFARSLADSVRHGNFLFSDGILFEVTRPVKTHAAASVVSVIVGVACGTAAAAFTAATLAWDRHVRARFVMRHRWRRLVEPCIYMLLFLTLAIVLPFAFPCRESGCVAMPDGGLVCKENSAIARDLFYAGDGRLNERAVEESMETFTCRQQRSAVAPFVPPNHDDALIPGAANHTAAAPLQRRYNELATLMHVTGEDAIRHLMSRGTHLEFGFGSIAAFLLIYGAFAALSAGSCIASGLLVPMLIMGACIGRLCGLAAVKMATRAGYSAADLLATDEWAWIDPGVFATVGAGAFLGGGSRQALSAAVIMMETTSEVHFLLPILLSIAVAKWVADALKPHGLYHSILEQRGVPFLPAEPPRGVPLKTRSVREVAFGPVVTLHECGSLAHAAEALRRTGYHAFPVVSASEDAHVITGVIGRDHLRRVVARALATPRGHPMRSLTWPELEGKAGADGARPAVWPPDEHSCDSSDDDDVDEGTPLLDASVLAPSPPATPRPGSALTEGASPNDAFGGRLLDLSEYVNRSAPCVPDAFSVLRAYDLFRSLGLRHLPVVDERGRAAGMVTRKELLHASLRARLCSSPDASSPGAQC